MGSKSITLLAQLKLCLAIVAGIETCTTEIHIEAPLQPETTIESLPIGTRLPLEATPTGIVGATDPVAVAHGVVTMTRSWQMLLNSEHVQD